MGNIPSLPEITNQLKWNACFLFDSAQDMALHQVTTQQLICWSNWYLSSVQGNMELRGESKKRRKKDPRYFKDFNANLVEHHNQRWGLL